MNTKLKFLKTYSLKTVVPLPQVSNGIPYYLTTCQQPDNESNTFSNI